MEEKECVECIKTKPLRAFAKNPYRVGGRAVICIACQRVHSQLYQPLNAADATCLPTPRAASARMQRVVKLGLDIVETIEAQDMTDECLGEARAYVGFRG